MRIYSLTCRDHKKNEAGYATVYLSTDEIMLLSAILHRESKGLYGECKMLKMAEEFYVLSALAQHGGFDSVDVRAINELDGKYRMGGKSK